MLVFIFDWCDLSLANILSYMVLEWSLGIAMFYVRQNCVNDCSLKCDQVFVSLQFAHWFTICSFQRHHRNV